MQRHYAALFENSPELTAGGVNMVFAGQQDDPATVAALKELGYARPEQVLETCAAGITVAPPQCARRVRANA